ncbi:MAG: [protein-PII] uridylyltransferase [Rhodospirillaceae bacterium]|jgi:[protein-PII] uridylyltransferase|nr:[protein-PII] uridylyltransferase [Rhodospirillaceae bacterium]MBT5243044.1 [protein-PII] uridylyltransferase [Rhodospirillaceae bacterium]MBT5563269.1 [protein-PII] uridylyltransferase [Rhodospirillaceae bacterium]MBT6243583.1 [protein-PII] uridylyltransferase [Rhodospirillaceae bacterium]MBT7136485.1 [protein-PII] uridylyltransferase [Rhodospirillaceae bacterium]
MSATLKKIPRQRDIIDRKALFARFTEMAAWSGIGTRNRGEVLVLFKETLAAGNAEIRRRFEHERVKGADTVRAQSFLIDQLIRVLYDTAVTYVYPVANPTIGEQISIIATGGYGRGELAPYSDIDLMFLLNYKRTPRTEQVIEYMLYMLWDLGLKVGHATRSVEEAVKLSHDDLTIRTSLLEARYLWGDEALYKRFKEKFSADIEASSGPAFVDAKLAERDERHERMGDTRYVLEPNVKEGKGALRDVQTLFWIAKYLYRVEAVEELIEKAVLTKRDAKRFAKVQNFLWTVRCHLHYLAGRPEERLTFNVQSELAARMAYKDHAGSRGVERFMKHYFLVAKDVGDLTRIICAVLESEHKKKRFRLPRLSFLRRDVQGFRFDVDRLALETPDAFKKDPIKLLTLFAEAQRLELDIHPSALRSVTESLRLIDKVMRREEAANAVFMDILTSRKNPELALRRLNEAGVFGRFITEFGRVVAQMQYDMYHVYTVDEHTIRAIGILARIEEGKLADDHPVATSVIRELQSRRALYVAVLLHDIAKGRGGDHSEIGGTIARKLCPRLGLNEWESDTVVWLVEQHLSMSRTAFKRDVDDPKTISDFVEVVQSPERLRLLLILTVVDIRAVGPGVWNGWKAQLLRDLYYSAQETMAGGTTAEVRSKRVARAKEKLVAELADWKAEDIDAHIAKGYDDYWLCYDEVAHAHHARMIAGADAKGRDITIENRLDQEREVTEVVIYTHDHPGVFARIAAAMSLTNATIVDARISTLANGMALDTFWIQDADGGPFDRKEHLKRLKGRIADALNGKLQPAQELKKLRERAIPSRTGVFKVPPRVLIDNTVSAKYTVIEVNGRDRQGFLSDVTGALTGIGLQIASAHISTYGERVVDVFYVKDVFGLRVDHDRKTEQIKKALLEAITPPEDKKQAATVTS